MARPPLVPYSPHGGPDERPFRGLDFSVNTNPYGPNPLLLQAVRRADHAHYPDPSYRAVRERLAAWHGVKAEQVALSVGVSDLFHRLCRAFLEPGDLLISWQAPFGELARAVALCRGRVRVLEEWPDALPAGVKLVYIGYPHNPTGRAVSLAKLIQLTGHCERLGALLLIDEAYAPFISLPSPPEHPAIVRLLSPGKAHGLVGVRPAYALASPEVIAALENLAPAWHLPAGTAAVLEQLPPANDFLLQTLPLVAQGAASLAQALAMFGQLEHHGTPFMTLRVATAVPQLVKRLRERGIKVRDCSSYGWPERIRVSTRQPPENESLLATLSALSDA